MTRSHFTFLSIADTPLALIIAWQGSAHKQIHPHKEVNSMGNFYWAVLTGLAIVGTWFILSTILPH
jgi:hypothetical protein